ncbi:MAG: hypothetical protein E7773_07795 [Sphingomonas sp.]|uniref:hypothetical protein n=1 Tax=Sphingomonas sp. TaxID=28214 RepID=UPI00121B4809|nr:hypothetical protein [Sphingomonas sp.]THD36403.1 MAG: hypothetical protein E7773_07795 [Sphingomonas sp.]
MKPFDFVFGLISVITSLALTHLVAGIVALIRNGANVTFSWRHAAWTWVAFALVVGNWASFWQLHTIETWPFHRIMIGLAFMISFYAFCALVIPEVVRGQPLNLGEFHEHEGRRYIIAHIIFAGLAMIQLALPTTSFMGWLLAARFALLASLLSFVALFTRRVWLQAVAAISLAVLSTYVMVSLTSVVAS